MPPHIHRKILIKLNYFIRKVKGNSPQFAVGFIRKVEGNFPQFCNWLILILKIDKILGKFLGLILEKFEYDSRLKADLIKFIKLNSTFLNFYYHFEIPHLS